MSDRSILETLESRTLLSGVSFYVSTTGSDTAAGTLAHPFKTIQHALNIANQPGDTVLVRAGTYHERLTLPASGTAAGGYITLENYPGENVILSGQNANTDDVGFGQTMIQIINKSYLKVKGLVITNNNGISVQDDAFGVRIQGSGSNVQILGNTIENMTGKVTKTSGGLNYGYAGAGIQVYGSSLTTPYSKVIISGNTITNCQPGDDSTETLTLNGNVTGFSVDHNTISHDNNIGIDMIGGEADIFNKPDGTLKLPVARNGVCVDNTVSYIHANYGDGYAGAIYVDGGQNIVVAGNHVSYSDLGIEVGCENHGYTASGIAVRDNLIDHNTQGGLVFGGYDKTVGKVINCTFTNNTLYHNDTTGQGNGEVWIQYADNCVVEDNIIVSTSQDLLINSQYTKDNVSNYNLLYCGDGAASANFVWAGKSYSDLSTYESGSGQDHTSIFAAPKFVAAGSGNFRLSSTSPAIDAGDPAFVPASGEVDFYGNPRLHGNRVDIGAAEFQ
jgi:hypothetical protein